jgi:hypothetical protein
MDYLVETRADACAALRKIAAELKEVWDIVRRYELAETFAEGRTELYRLGLIPVPQPDGSYCVPERIYAHRQQAPTHYVLSQAVKLGFFPGRKADEWIGHVRGVERLADGTQQYIPLDLPLKELSAWEFFDGVYQWVASWSHEVTTDLPPTDYFEQWIWAMETCAKRIMVPAAEAAGGGAGQVTEDNEKAAFTPTALADKFGLLPDTVKKALEKWRRQNLLSDGFIENEDANGNKPRFLYILGYVRPLLQAMKDRQTRRNSTGK